MQSQTSHPPIPSPITPLSDTAAGSLIVPQRMLPPPDQLAFELGSWMSGLMFFLSNWDKVAGDSAADVERTEDWRRHFEIVSSGFRLCADLNYDLRKLLAEETGFGAIEADDCNRLAVLLRDVISIIEPSFTNDRINFGSWKAVNDSLLNKLSHSDAILKFVSFSNRDGFRFLPSKLQGLLDAKTITFSDQRDLFEVLSRFGTIMRCLGIIRRMLAKDEPLKSTVLIFAKIYERLQDLIGFIDRRLARFDDETAELFGALDGTSYTASLEMKKVFQQELSGIVAIRPATSVYARVETAYSLLNDSFEQTVAVLAKLVDPNTNVSELFPTVQRKVEHSLHLRKSLSELMKLVQEAEQDPRAELLARLGESLHTFVSEPINYLFFKDRETFERFHEEIIATQNSSDLVPILHRFGAYLETLLNLVNMRMVLSNASRE